VNVVLLQNFNFAVCWADILKVPFRVLIYELSTKCSPHDENSLSQLPAVSSVFQLFIRQWPHCVGGWSPCTAVARWLLIAA